VVELVDHDSKRPYIRFESICIFEKPLRGHIERRADIQVLKIATK